MHWLLFLLLCALVHCEYMNSVKKTNDCANVKTFIGSVRKRRHLSFPEKSNVVLTISLVKAFMTHAPSGWNLSLEIDVLFPLPEEKITNRFFRKKLHHRQKRELWQKLQGALDFHNMNGRACILRSICEAKTHLAPPGKSLIHDILRTTFMAPLHDEEFREEMKEYTELLDPEYCEQPNDCPFSLLEFILALNKQEMYNNA